jgi:hypothetical protein
MSKYTKGKHERYLNDLYADLYHWQDVKEQFGHLTTVPFLWKAFQNRKLGSLFKKNDPIGFSVSYNEKTMR